MIVPGYREVSTAPGAGARGAARGGRPRRPGGVDLHRRLRARPRRAARRPPRDHPLVLRRRAGAALPGDRGRPRRALRRRGPVLTSAGLSAGIDLCLHICPLRPRRADRRPGRPRDGRLAAPRRRPGAVHRARAARRSDRPARSRRSGAGRSTISTEPLDVATLAARAGVSPRTFARRFVAETGTTPLQVAARPAGAGGAAAARAHRPAVEQVAARAGFGSAPSLREHFRRATATTPTAYRRAFAPV